MHAATAHNLDRDRIVEDVHVEYFAHLATVPGLEVHCDPDITWKVSPASAWSNCGVRLRLPENTALKRLDEILARYNANGRGAGFWVGASAQPCNVGELLKNRALRCRKYFPAMYCGLQRPLPEIEVHFPVRFETVTDYDIFKDRAHPSIGPLTTAMRRFRLESQRHLAALPERQSWELLALSGDTVAGICTVFIGKRYAGLFDLAVPELLRNRGIGGALVRHACAFARDRGAEGMVLIASNLGYRVYEHAGFSEVSRVGFWYTANP